MDASEALWKSIQEGTYSAWTLQATQSLQVEVSLSHPGPSQGYFLVSLRLSPGLLWRWSPAQGRGGL